MDAALAAAKTGLEAQQVRLQVINNNLANVSTDGFKSSRAVFEDLLYQIDRQPGASSSENTVVPTGLQLGTGSRIVATQTTNKNGPLQQTGKAYDLAIKGEGFFQIAKPDGSYAYTRNGSFTLNADRQLVTTSNGDFLQPSITIPADAIQVTIGDDGVVTSQAAGESTPTTVGTITLANFPNSAGLQAVGGNLFVETASSGSAQLNSPGTNGLGNINQGMLEGSNVNVVEELVNLIEAQRAYEMNSKAIETDASMLQFITQIA